MENEPATSLSTSILSFNISTQSSELINRQFVLVLILFVFKPKPQTVCSFISSFRGCQVMNVGHMTPMPPTITDDGPPHNECWNNNLSLLVDCASLDQTVSSRFTLADLHQSLIRR